jgi:hypothetical protein
VIGEQGTGNREQRAGDREGGTGAKLGGAPFPVPRSLLTFPPVPIQSHIWPSILVLALACGGKPPAPAPVAGSPPPKEPIKPLAVVPFAGQRVAVTPLTFVVALDTLAEMAPFAAHAAAIAWADSIVAAVVTARGPEVNWVLPPELRKIARRAPTVAPDPDRMGQSMMRENGVETVPDPLRSNLRSLMALAGGRFVFIPAVVSVIPEQGGTIRAEVSLVLVDTRTGKVIWRTLTWGVGSTPSRALTVAMEAVLPI